MKQLKKIKLGIIVTVLLPLTCFAVESTVHNTSANDGFPELNERYTKNAQRYELSQIQRIKTGLNKDQVRFILGNPHFDESLFGVKTWNYIVDIQAENSTSYERCQLKIEFNKNYLADQIHWKGESCQQRFAQK